MIHNSAGIPCWVDLGSPDVETSIAFYRGLFGWGASPAEQTSGYRMFSLDGKLVSGIRPLQSELRSPQWTTYISTDDAARVVRRAEAAGGSVLMTTDLKEEARSVLLQDPVGAVFGLWQPGTHRGAQLFNQPGSLTFNLLLTREPEAGKQFYSQVFDWEPRERDMGGGFVFTYFFNGVRGVAGVMAMNGQWPEDVSPHWQVSFAVEDADATAAHAIELGGNAQPPRNTPFGRSARITDPYGTAFSISQQTPAVRAAALTPQGVLI